MNLHCSLGTTSNFKTWAKSYARHTIHAHNYIKSFAVRLSKKPRRNTMYNAYFLTQQLLLYAAKSFLSAKWRFPHRNEKYIHVLILYIYIRVHPYFDWTMFRTVSFTFYVFPAYTLIYYTLIERLIVGEKQTE